MVNMMKYEDEGDLFALLERHVQEMKDKYTEPLPSLILRYIVGRKPLKWWFFKNRMRDRFQKRKKKLKRRIERIRWFFWCRYTRIKHIKNAIRRRVVCWFLFAGYERKGNALFIISVIILISTARGV